MVRQKCLPIILVAKEWFCAVLICLALIEYEGEQVSSLLIMVIVHYATLISVCGKFTVA